MGMRYVHICTSTPAAAIQRLRDACVAKARLELDARSDVT